MAKPTTKEELLTTAAKQWDKLWALMATLSDEQQRGSFELDGKEAHWRRDKNLRDVLIHLYEWQQLFLNWVDSNTKGTEKPFLREPYNWKTYGDMNVDFWNEHQKTSFDDSVQMIKDSHQKVLAMIETFSTEQLFTKGVFSWTGGSSLGQYCISVTSGHYDWAMKKIKKYKAELAN